MTINEAVEQLKDLQERNSETELDVQALDVALSVLSEGEPDEGFATLAEANEAYAWDKGKEAQQYDRYLFVRNLGWLLSQTRRCVATCALVKQDRSEVVVVYYKPGGTREIDVTGDSYLAIIKDVTKRV
jgi:hypothetical protein